MGSRHGFLIALPGLTRSSRHILIMFGLNSAADPRRPDRIHRYKPSVGANQGNEDLTPDYMNVLGMVFSMCGLMMRMKWAAWAALYCSCISFASSKINDQTDSEQFHAVHFGCCHVLPAKPTAHDAPLVF